MVIKTQGISNYHLFSHYLDRFLKKCEINVGTRSTSSISLGYFCFILEIRKFIENKAIKFLIQDNGRYHNIAHIKLQNGKMCRRASILLIKNWGWIKI